MPALWDAAQNDLSEAEKLGAVLRNSRSLKLIDQVSDDLRFSAVQADGHALKYLDPASVTLDLAIEGVTNSTYAYEFVPEHLKGNERLLLLVATNDARMLQFMPRGTEVPQDIAAIAADEARLLHSIPPTTTTPIARRPCCCKRRRGDSIPAHPD